jgi:hypothetical protein
MVVILSDSFHDLWQKYIKKLNSVALVRKRTIPTERPPLVGEVSAKIHSFFNF